MDINSQCPLPALDRQFPSETQSLDTDIVDELSDVAGWRLPLSLILVLSYGAFGLLMPDPGMKRTVPGFQIFAL